VSNTKIGKLKDGPFAGSTLYIASQDKIDKYDARLQDLLEDVFGIGGALITDESTLDDFACTAEDLRKLHDDYGVDADSSDTLLSVAERIWG